MKIPLGPKNEMTLYFPAGDGVKEGSHTATYKNIKDLETNGNGTVTFRTQKHGTITTPLLWRIKDGVEIEEQAAPAKKQNQW